MTEKKEAVLVDETIVPLLPVQYATMSPAEVFKPGNMDMVIAALKKQAEDFTPDVTTPKGRKEIASFSAKFSRSKTFLDGKGKEMVAEIKAKAVVIDQERKRFRDTCDELRDKSREPLTEWEDKEKARIAAEEQAREIEKAHDEALHENDLFDRQKEIERKEAEFARIEAEQKQKEEAERLEKERVEREEKIRKETEAKAKREAEEAAARAKEESERRERELKEQAERAEREKVEAAAKAKAEKERAVREAKEQAEAEAKRKQEEEEARKESERIEAEKKAANKRHRAKVKVESCRFIKGIYGTTQEQAEGIFDAISSGEVPHITVNY